MPRPGDILEALDRAARRSPSLWKRLTAPQLFVGSFFVLIAAGTLLLLLLPGLYAGPRLGFIDALFTATSAVCVTGLIVVDTATHFTPLGQAVILFLIQLGGLGILSFTTVIVLLMGRRLSLRGESTIASEVLPHLEPAGVLAAVFRYTLVIEGLGALALWINWVPDFGVTGAIWPAVFHAISAFCNAGFSTFSDNLIGFSGRPSTLLIVSLLVILGGLGFFVLEEVRLVLRRAHRQLSLHTRLVLLTTVLLLAVGTVFILVFEWNNVLAGHAWWSKGVEAFFMSAMPRTAGFNSIDYNRATSATLFLTIVLMLIGGSPGSAAGGLKTTTFAILGALAIARVRGRQAASAFRRTIPEATIERAVGLVIFALTLIGVAIMMLQVSELGGVAHSASGGRFLDLVFEAVSAFDTVGLSTGVTFDLTGFGKVLLVVLMYVGRVGPFTLVASMVVAAARKSQRYRYAAEDVIVG